ncbi:MAG: aliphatic sulfonate ABC transporter substrate-binding protein [Kineosporiaceae bacterium]
MTPTARPAALAAALAAAVLAAACGTGDSRSGTALGDASPAAGDAAALSVDALNLDYAYYNPASLVLREQGWLEAAAGEDVEVTWTLSQGSNKANEALRGGAVDVASTAGSAALVARANGGPNVVVDVLGLPEWSAIVVPADSDIAAPEDLAGRTVAATIGTDPYFFLLQTLAEAGLSLDDVEVVNLQHADGRTALVRGDVDAWAGLDPIMADAELADGVELAVRAPERNTYSVLNVREDWLAEHPDAVELVLEQYERARRWIAENPDETAELLAQESGVDLEVAETVLDERTDLTVDPVPGDAQREVLERVVPIVVAEDQVRDEATVTEALDTLFATEPITTVTAP